MGLVVLSIAIAVVASFIALWLAFHPSGGARMLVGALVMGVAVSGLHYTGMAAAHFIPDPNAAAPPAPGLTPPRLGMVIFLATAAALVIALLLKPGRQRRTPV